MTLFYVSSVLYVVLEHFYLNLIDSFWKKQCFFDKLCFRPRLVLLQMIWFFWKTSSYSLEKWLGSMCNSVLYVVLEHFYLNLMDSFWKNQCFFDKHCFQAKLVLLQMIWFFWKTSSYSLAKWLGSSVVLYFTSF